jgi:hypothetical protein
MMPLGFSRSARSSFSSSGRRPICSRFSETFERSRTRITTLSPCMVGSVETRRSTGLPPMLSSMRPSWGSRVSAMSRFDMTLTREITARASWMGGGIIS